MPTLADALRKNAHDKILDREGQSDGRGRIKNQIVNLVAWKADGLVLFGDEAIDMQDFAATIEDHKPDLHPWVTVYGAALGMMAVWNRILFAWARSEPPQNDPIPPEVQTLIDTLIPNYVMWIAS
jgi:hypothetical protein